MDILKYYYYYLFTSLHLVCCREIISFRNLQLVANESPFSYVSLQSGGYTLDYVHHLVICVSICCLGTELVVLSEKTAALQHQQKKIGESEDAHLG